MKQQILREQLSYWKQRLANCSPALQLPTDQARRLNKTYRGATHETVLSQSLSEELKSMSRREETALFILLLAGFKILLHRYANQDDILLGIPVRGRSRTEFESLIGCFENSLPLRSDLSGNPSALEVLARVRQGVQEAFSNQDIPLEKLVEESHPGRDLSREPLFQITFQMRDAAEIGVQSSLLRSGNFEFETELARHDLSLEIIDQPKGIRCLFKYNADLFAATTMSRMAGHFQTLLESILVNPDQNISTLPFLNGIERHQLLVEWNTVKIQETESAFPHELFEAQAERTPNSVALSYGRESLTYDQLNHRSNQLAHHLQSIGAGPDVLVGLCMEHSPDLVVAILAILKAGAACVPLDPGIPNDRIAFMVKNANVSIILTQERFEEKLPGFGMRVVCVDSIREKLNQYKGTSPVTALTEENLAQVYYTSGSTGEPKAVMRNHQKQSKQPSWAQTTFHLTENDRFLMKAPIGLTPLSIEIFWPLLTGARLFITPPGVGYDSASLVKHIAKYEITVINFVPSMLRVFLDEPGLERCSSLRQVICFGEILPAELEERFFARLSADLSVIYGTTEAPSSVFRKCQPGQQRQVVNIGRRLGNKQVYVANSHLQLNPIGVPGEIFVGGGLARGYLNRPDLTAEKFIPDPFSDTAGARLYKTGDMARYLPDGSLEFLGRIDHQVKIRGFRIELQEIESKLRQHPDVHEAVVLEKEYESGDRRLVAYLVHRGKQTLKNDDLRSFLKEKLPNYMVPSSFIVMESLPLTTAGKVDRKALLGPDSDRPQLEESYVAPRTPTEEVLVGIWCEILGLKQIGVHDNFFELGGHSLLVPRLHAQIQKAFGKALPFAALFQAPTVEQLAEILRQEGDPPQWSSLVVVQPRGTSPPFFCVHGYAGYPYLAKHLGLEQPFYGLVQGLDGKKFFTRVEEIAAAYIKELRIVQPDGPYFLGGHSFGGLVAFEMSEQLHRQGQEVALLALLDSDKPSSGMSPSAAESRWGRSAGRWARICLKISRHLKNLGELPAQAKGRYILSLLRIVLNQISHRARQAVCEGYLALGWPLPPGLRTFYINEVLFGGVYHTSARQYRPVLYRGNVVFFRSETSTKAPEFSWGSLVDGELKVYNVPGSHLGMLEEPNIQILADQLKTCLEEASTVAGRMAVLSVIP